MGKVNKTSGRKESPVRYDRTEPLYAADQKKGMVFMKKLFSLLAVVVILLAFSTASADTIRDLYGPTFSKVGTAYLTDPSQNGYILLSVSSSPDITEQFLGQLDLFCSAADYLNISDFVPGCSFVDFAGKFYKYVSKGMQVDLEYRDPSSGAVIWPGTLEDGSIMYLGNDHPAYEIWIKCHGLSYPWVKLIMLDNITWQ